RQRPLRDERAGGEILKWDIGRDANVGDVVPLAVALDVREPRIEPFLIGDERLRRRPDAYPRTAFRVLQFDIALQRRVQLPGGEDGGGDDLPAPPDEDGERLLHARPGAQLGEG